MTQNTQLDAYEELVATAILGIDTVWGGDVNNPSGVGRFIADCYFSGKDYPAAYTDPLAARIRETGGLSGKEPDKDALRKYIATYDLRGRVQDFAAAGRRFEGLRGGYVRGLANVLEIMLELAQEMLGDGPAVPYERCVEGSCDAAPSLCDATEQRAQVTALLEKLGYPLSAHGGDLGTAVDAWRASCGIARDDIAGVSDSVIPELDALTAKNVVPHLPAAFHDVPRANITFELIENAWFSGSMNYLGRKRTEAGDPQYEASYEINASLEISKPEFHHLVSHEVVPGHVMTFALVQNLYHRGEAGFESTILTMNSRYSTLAEGIANSAIFMAYGITEMEDLPDDETRLGVILSLLQDQAKNNASYLKWAEGLPGDEIAARLRKEFLVSEERADKLSNAWAAHPLLGRMYLPAYHRGTSMVMDLLRRYGAEKTIPALYGAHGLVDCATVEQAIRTAA